MVSTIFELFKNTSSELQIVYVAIGLYLIWFLLNMVSYHWFDYKKSPYYVVLYSSPEGMEEEVFSFGVVISFSYLIPLILSYAVFSSYDMISKDFTLSRFLIISGIVELFIIYSNILIAKVTLKLPIIDIEGWKRLGQEIKQNVEKIESTKKKKDVDDESIF